MIAKENKPYSMSFSTGALFQQQSVMLAELYADLGDWKSVRANVLASNLLQSRTKNTAHRVCREIISRLKLLTPDQLLIMTGGSLSDQGHILWAAVCKRYQFIHDFAVVVAPGCIEDLVDLAFCDVASNHSIQESLCVGPVDPVLEEGRNVDQRG